ncbi:hypothetical protein TIFTF001_021823 [Ficus carica]|uniref:Uncharacterized protein n=1 Tax=Ficus carica TaxID=3494 RepID=A0AA88DC98_FICCA|nr:hypothetical protein TIFTF001_021823 [Ficus carica]
MLQQDGESRLAPLVIKDEQKELNELLFYEELMWKLKSRLNGLKEGDRCTRFFRTSTVMRLRQNWIESIRDESRCSHNSRNSIAKVFLDKFQDLFFGVLKRNVEVARVAGWKRKLISKAGQLTLLKSMVQALPSYSMLTIWSNQFSSHGILTELTSWSLLRESSGESTDKGSDRVVEEKEIVKVVESC